MILFSLRTQFAEAIFAGSKRHEFRRVAPRRCVPGLALIYETKPLGLVTGTVFVEGIIPVPQGCAKMIAAANDPFSTYYDEYLLGAREPIALELSRPTRFSNPIQLQYLTGLQTAPQSYCYVDASRSEIIDQLRR